MKKKICLLFSILIQALVLPLNAQIADKKYFLVDSLDLSSLHLENKAILDSVLPLYHKAGSDSMRYALLEAIVENSADYDFCEKYNTLLFNSVKKQLQDKKNQENSLKLYRRFYATALIYKGLIFTDRGKMNEALKAYQEALKLFEQLNYKTGIGYALNNIGAYYHRTGNLTEAINYYKRGLKINEEIGDERGVGSLLYNIAGIYDSQGAIKQALEYYNLCILKFEKLKISRGVAYCLNNIATIYEAQNENEKALEYTERCRKLFEKEGDKVGVAFCLNNMGALYRDKGNTGLALQYLKESLALGTEIKNTERIANASVNLGVLYDGLKQYDSALVYLQKAKALFEGISDKEGQAGLLNNLSNVYAHKNQIDKAVPLSLKSLSMGRELQMPSVVKEASESLYRLYKRQNNYTKSLEMYELFIQMRDSIQSEKVKKEAIRSQFETEFSLKALSDSLEFARVQETKDLQIKIQTGQIENEKVLRISLIVGLILIVITALLIYRSYKLKVKDNLLIAAQRNQLERKNQENEVLMNEIHHRIKNNLQIISSLLKLPQQQISETTAKEVMNASRERVQSIAIIHKLLYESDNKKLIDAKKYIEELSSEIIKNFSGSNALEVTMELESVLVDVDKMVPLGLVVNELLLNAIKHAFVSVQDPRLSIQLQKEGEQLVLRVNDNGPVDLSNKMKETSDTFGAKLVFTLARQLDGTVDVFYLNGMNVVFKFKE